MPTVSVRLSRHDRAVLELLAAERGLTVSDVVREAIRQRLGA